ERAARGGRGFLDRGPGGNFAHLAHAFTEELDKGHGRRDVRRYWISEDLRARPGNRGLRVDPG
ncbi:MAG: hypothetical protein WAM94_00125, partial [Chromatiaceae bacterium]